MELLLLKDCFDGREETMAKCGGPSVELWLVKTGRSWKLADVLVLSNDAM